MMTTLNRRLQLAILNRKKSRNFLQKGFTLVELMVVIVIVGILSGVALPNFLSQTEKAKATEASTGSSKAAKVAMSAYYEDPTLPSLGAKVAAGGICPDDTTDYSYACTVNNGSEVEIVSTLLTGKYINETITTTFNAATGGEVVTCSSNAGTGVKACTGA